MFRKLLIITCLSGIVFTTLAQKNRKSKDLVTIGDQTEYKKTGAPLPDVRFYSKEGKYITNKDLANDASLIIMLFNPTCEHCEDQARLFKEYLTWANRVGLSALPIRPLCSRSRQSGG